jgi:DNA-binding MarR family transcriptional regulator
MENNNVSTEQKLMRAFMQFNKAGWHHRSVAGCKPSEIWVLFCIKKGVNPDAPEMKVSDISKLLHVTSPTITQLIIDPTDRRAVGIKLTEKGEIVTKKARDAFLASFHGLVEYLGEEQSNQLAELLSKVFVYFNEKEASLNQSQNQPEIVTSEWR